MNMLTDHKDLISYNNSICKELRTICAPIFSSIGLADLTYVKFINENKRFIISTNDRWIKDYVEYELYNCKEHNNIWKTFVFNNNNTRYAFWSSFKETSVFREAFQHNMCNGFYLFNGNELYGFSNTTTNPNNLNNYINNLLCFEKFIHHFKSETKNIIKQADKINICTEKMNSTDGFDDSYKKNTNLDIQNLKQKKFYLGDNFPGKYLTCAEFKSLYYICKGASLKEVASNLDLSPRTIETYINNAKYRLECVSKIQLLKCIYRSDLKCFLAS